MKKTLIYLLIALMVTGCSSAQSREENGSAEELINQRIESIGKQGQAVKDLIESPNAEQKG